MFTDILLNKLVRPSRAGGGLNESYNQIAQDALNRNLLQSEALSKGAYANWVAPQSLMAYLNTPGVRTSMSNEQYNHLINLAGLMTQNSLTNIQGQGRGYSPIEAAVGWLGNKLGFGQQPQSKSPNTFRKPLPGAGGDVGVTDETPPVPQQDQNQPEQKTNELSGQKLLDYFENQRVNGQYVPGWEPGDPPVPKERIIQNAFAHGVGTFQPSYAPPMGGATPSARQAAQEQIPGSMGGFGHPTAAKVQEEAAKTAAVEQQKTFNKQWETQQNDAADQTKRLQLLQKNADDFHNAYNKSFYRGPRLGSLPTEGFFAAPTIPESLKDYFPDSFPKSLRFEQIGTNAQNNMQNQIAQEMSSNKLTNQELRFAGGVKLNMKLEPEAEKDLYESITATTRRFRDRSKFYSLIRQNVPSIDPNVAIQLWDLSLEQYPPYIHDKEGNTIPQPKNNDKWKLYTTKEAVDAVANNGTYDPRIFEYKGKKYKRNSQGGWEEV